MPQASRVDPYDAFNFFVELDGIVSASFSEVTGLDSETDVIEYRTGDMRLAVKIPGLHRWSKIVLKRGLTKNLDLWNWREQVIAGKPERRNGSIVLLSADQTPILRINFRNGWPCKWEGPTLNAGTSEVAIETLEIAHEGFDVVGG
ncbi:MAG: phage tail protein [Actinobacteria bacterium]|nr:phage tail protein [Actinomycetota bacterium]